MLLKAERDRLLIAAASSIDYGLQHHCKPSVDLSGIAGHLAEPGAAFVTLLIDNQLRGCIGHLEAVQPLFKDVSDNAYMAAFEDPRFPPLQPAERGQLEIHISVLSPPIPFPVENEQDLLEKLCPGRDGLILKEGFRQSTFLPSVWEQLPTPREFLQHLKQKAGLPGHYWSDNMEFQRYGVEEFS